MYHGHRAREHDNAKAKEIDLIERSGTMPYRWNGSSEREHLQTQRQGWNLQKSRVRNDQLSQFDELQVERDLGVAKNKEFLERQKQMDERLKSLQYRYKVDKMAHLKEQQKELHNDIEVEKESHLVWGVRCKVIDNKMQKLKDNGLTGAQSDGPRHHPSVGSSSNASQGAETTTKTGSLNLELSVQPSPVDNVDREVENNHHTDMVVETSHQQVVQANELISKSVPPEIPFDLGPQLGDVDLSFANIQDIDFTLLSQVADPVVDDI
ncbi:hypothetical protein L208DRAFT_1379586 [Tricholoma matsutake]|nr:hypothetical protein L208DRAFT_1379586 [Tricholoma matsutake 945]